MPIAGRCGLPAPDCILARAPSAGLRCRLRWLLLQRRRRRPRRVLLRRLLLQETLVPLLLPQKVLGACLGPVCVVDEESRARAHERGADGERVVRGRHLGEKPQRQRGQQQHRALELLPHRQRPPCNSSKQQEPPSGGPPSQSSPVGSIGVSWRECCT
jgi:hypothetical protein